MLKEKFTPTVVLLSICLAVALLLAAVNLVTLPIIQKAQEQKLQNSLRKVMPLGEDFEEISTDKLDAAVTKAFTEKNGGFVFQVEVTGYKPGLIIVCGIDADGKITGADYISSSETLSAEVGLGEKFVGHTSSTITPEIIAGPTAKLTTNAYYKAIQIALESYAALQNK